MKESLERVKDWINDHKIWTTIIVVVLVGLLSLVSPGAADRTANILDKVGNLFGIFADIHINEHEVMVTLDPNGGELDINTREVLYEKTYGSLPTPERAGMVFVGWYIDNGTEVNGDTNVTTKSDHTLKARWGVTLSFDTNDGRIASVSPYQVIWDHEYGTLPTPKKDGATFFGWYTTPECEIQVTAETKVTAEINHTLYAKWEKTSYNQVTFSIDGCELIEDFDRRVCVYNLQTITYLNGATYTVAYSGVKTGKVFLGWALSPKGSVVYRIGDIIGDVGTITLYAIFK